MQQARKVVVHSLAGYRPEFDALVKHWVDAGVNFVGVVGVEAEKLESVVDELCVGDSSAPYFMLTSSHPHESLIDAVAFANMLTGEYSGPVQVVEF